MSNQQLNLLSIDFDEDSKLKPKQSKSKNVKSKYNKNGILSTTEHDEQHNSFSASIDANINTSQSTPNTMCTNTLEQKEIIQEYTVSEISTAIKKAIETNFSSVKVVGEISNLKVAASGHAYFNLKDQNAVIACTCWSPVMKKITVPITDGMEVCVIGKISTYQGQSKYQLNILYIKHTGIGALMQIINARKEKLKKEGLFDQKYKKKLPLLPKKIGVITSLSGAVIKDIIHRIKERCPTHLIIWPGVMQGDLSAISICKGISYFNMHYDVDLIIIARGGGSIEDLWSFNEENVVRSAFASVIPIVSAIGHETDFTLLDFVADLRAPTPTGAAEMCVPVLRDLDSTLSHYYLQISDKIFAKIEHAKQILRSYDNTVLANPQNFLYRYEQRVDYLESYFNKTPQFLSIKYNQIEYFYKRFPTPKKVIEILSIKITNIKIKKSIDSYIQLLDHKTNILESKIESVNFGKILKKGFALLTDENGKVITKIEELTEQKNVSIKMHDGTVKAKIL